MVKQQKLKKFKVFYFIEPEHAWEDEKRKSIIIYARSESEAEEIFKHEFLDCNFGWIEELACELDSNGRECELYSDECVDIVP